MRLLLYDNAPISPVSVEVFSMPRTAALESASLAEACPFGGPFSMDRDAPVMAETLLDLLLRPLTLDTGSVKGIVPPFEACS